MTDDIITATYYTLRVPHEDGAGTFRSNWFHL